MKAIYLPCILGNIVKAISYLAVILLDLLHFVLTPIKWIQFKAHLFLAFLAGASYVYMKFYEHIENALLYALFGLSAAILFVLFLKIARKEIHRLRQMLIKIVYEPLGVCIYMRPILLRPHYFVRKKLAKCVMMD